MEKDSPVKVVIHSNGPHMQTGYGLQAAQIGLGFSKLGHEVAFSAFAGLQGNTLSWNGMPIFPGGRDDWGMDLIVSNYKRWKADLLVTLMDTWVIDPGTVIGSGMKMAYWTPVDCSPLSVLDEASLRRTHALPIAMSRHGEKMLKQAFFKPWYAPHAIDTTVFTPPADRNALRREMGLDGKFVIGINAANRDHHRKAFGEQFAAFAKFHVAHPDSVLMVHTIAENFRAQGLDLNGLRDRLGLQDCIRFTEPDDILTGAVTQEMLARWYGALDLFSSCSRGEGFGIPIIEAQACGTPVVVTRASSMPELCGSGKIVGGQDFWSPLHHSWWVTPSVKEVAAAYELALRYPERKRQQAREFALSYDQETVLQKYWVPILEFLEAH